MSTVYLIRHGQASFGASDYDVLSGLGAEQARCLGSYWAEKNRGLDAVYTGPRRRHVDTAGHVLDGARAAGARYPEPIAEDALDEYPAFLLLEHLAPVLEQRDPVFRELLSATGERGKRNDGRFERVFRYLLDRWALGELDTGKLESFAQFRDRVRGGLRRIMDAQGRKRRVAVITSGGPICIAMQMALGVADDVAMRLGWVIGNGSVSEFRYRDPRELTLMRFNSSAHLSESQITFR